MAALAALAAHKAIYLSRLIEPLSLALPLEPPVSNLVSTRRIPRPAQDLVDANRRVFPANHPVL